MIGIISSRLNRTISINYLDKENPESEKMTSIVTDYKICYCKKNIKARKLSDLFHFSKIF